MSFIKSIATFSGFTMVSRLTGFLRDMVIASFLGAGMVSDAFLVAFKLPNLFRSLFAEGAFTSAFVPLFSSKLVASGRDKSVEFAAKAISLLTFFLILFTIIFELCMPWVVKILAPGFMENPEKLVTFGTYPDAVSAYIAKGVLNTNGIECVITNERMSGIFPLPDLPIGQVRILVFEKDLEMARNIMSSTAETKDNDNN